TMQWTKPQRSVATGVSSGWCSGLSKKQKGFETFWELKKRPYEEPDCLSTKLSRLSLTGAAQKIEKGPLFLTIFCLPLPSFHKPDGCGDLLAKTVNRPGFSQVIW